MERENIYVPNPTCRFKKEAAEIAKIMSTFGKDAGIRFTKPDKPKVRRIISKNSNF